MINGFPCCFNFAFNFNLRRYTTDVAGTLITTVQISGTSIKSSPFTQTVLPGSPSVGWCRLNLSNPS